MFARNSTKGILQEVEGRIWEDPLVCFTKKKMKSFWHAPTASPRKTLSRKTLNFKSNKISRTNEYSPTGTVDEAMRLRHSQ